MVVGQRRWVAERAGQQGGAAVGEGRDPTRIRRELDGAPHGLVVYCTTRELAVSRLGRGGTGWTGNVWLWEQGILGSELGSRLPKRKGPASHGAGGG